MNQEELNKKLEGKSMTFSELNFLRLKTNMEFNFEFRTKMGKYLMWGSGPISSESGLDDFAQANATLKYDTICSDIKAH